MSGPEKVIVLDPDPRAGRQVQLGFEREGISVVVAQDVGKLELGPDTGLALVGGTDGRAVELVRRTRAALVASNADIPIVSTGRGVTRSELETAGADEVVTKPAYLRDLVTIARIMRGATADHRRHFVGSLVETTGVYTLVRALSALGRSAVLTLIRGLRRGEVRFHHGEVTSAQVGLIHGQAAFHQLLLWTDARFDFAHEDVVRRQQIPLPPDELFADAERFLEGVRESAEKLSPSMVLEQNAQHVMSLGKLIPIEVHSVLRMFDGHRVLADVLEDSPYRVFETLRVAQKAMEAGLLQSVEAQRPKATWRAMLAIEEWLVGSETRDAVVERTAKLVDSGPISTTGGSGKKNSRKKRKKRRANTPAAVPILAKTDIDWGALVPRTIGAEVGSLAGVVPAMDTHGEIEVSTRDHAREGLEALMDTDKRDRIFPRDVGVEPSVVIRGEDTDEWERIEGESKAKVNAEAEAKAKAQEEADAKAKQDADAKAKQDADAKAKLEADAKAKQDADVKAKLEADAKAKQDADTKAKQDAEAHPERETQRVREEAQAKVREQVERLRVDRILKEQADARAAEQAARGAAAEEARAYAARIKATADAKREEAERSAREVAEHARQQAEREREAGDRAAAQMIAVPAVTADRSSTRELLAKPITVTETATAMVTVSDTMTVDRTALPFGSAAGQGQAPTVDRTALPFGSAAGQGQAPTVDRTALPFGSAAGQGQAPTVVGVADTVTVTATPVVTIRESSVGKPPGATPIATEDEPSDGIVRAMITTVDTARLAARAQQRRAPSAPVIEGPILKDTTGEIRPSAQRAIDPVEQEPSVLVSDLAAAHTAVAAAMVGAKPTTLAAVAGPAGDAASPSRELAVSEVRRDAVAFTEQEEAFFKNADGTHPNTASVPRVESFDDLDEGYQPPKFWDRVFGRSKRDSSTGLLRPPPPPKKR